VRDSRLINRSADGSSRGDGEGVAVAQITDQQRTQRVQELLNELNKVPPEKHESRRIHLTTGDVICDVIKMPADEVLLNHRSHRIRSQLDGDPEWENVKADPTSEAAQKIIQRYVRASRSDKEFDELKESLIREGQIEPGVVTRDGVLVNANTRAVAMREMESPDNRNLSVAVLPPTIQPEELGLLELRLQMQKELKKDYSLTNELLFIEELSNERGMSDAAIAKEMFPENPKKGTQEVPLRLKYLDLLRIMCKIPDKPLRLKQFDSLSLEQMRVVHAKYESLLEQDAAQARAYLESFLLSVLVDVVSVHQIRQIDTEFVKTYMLPSLEEDELIGQHAAHIAEAPESGPSSPKGAKALMGGATATADGDAPNVVSLINAVAGDDHNVKVPGTNLVLEKKDVTEALKTAVVSGIRDKKRDERETNRLEAPIEAIKTATREVGKANDALKVALGDSDFDKAHHKTLEASFKKLARTVKSFETAMSKAGIIDS
jgi:hypothetical protein